MMPGIPSRLIARIPATRAIAGAAFVAALGAASGSGLFGVSSITLGVGLSLASGPAQAARPAGCGHLGQRPCNVWEFIPSCEAGLTEVGTCRNLAAEAAAAAAATRAAADRAAAEAAATKAAADRAAAEAKAVADRNAAAAKAAADKAAADARAAAAATKAAADKAAADAKAAAAAAAKAAADRAAAEAKAVADRNAAAAKATADKAAANAKAAAAAAKAAADRAAAQAKAVADRNAAAAKATADKAAADAKAISGRPSACGHPNQRPCTVVEFIPSCAQGLKEDFASNKCVPLAPGERSPFLAGLKSAGLKGEAVADAARKVCMNAAADYVQAHGRNPSTSGMTAPGAAAGYGSQALQAYVAIGFACSTPHLLNMVSSIAETVGAAGGGSPISIEQEITKDYQRWYDTPICAGAKDASGRVACAVAGMVGGEASEGVLCVIKGAQAGAFDDFVAGGARSERAFGLAIGQVLYILGEAYAMYRATNALAGPLKEQVKQNWKAGIARAWNAAPGSLATAVHRVGVAGSFVGEVVAVSATVVGGVHTAEKVIGKLGNIRECTGSPR